ncbi:MAG: hypothetical protein WCT77_03100, partial [Bacteroidota bacterium]
MFQNEILRRFFNKIKVSSNIKFEKKDLRKKIVNIILPFIFLASLIAQTGCNEQPTSLGFSLLYDTINIKTLSSNDSSIIDFTNNYTK